MKALNNLGILITRAGPQSSPFSEQLQAQGARVVEMPTLAIGAPSSWEALDRQLGLLSSFQWLVLTSVNGVEAVLDRYHQQFGESLAEWQGKLAQNSAQNSTQNSAQNSALKIAVVGQKTAAALETTGIAIDFSPQEFIADALVAQFPEPLAGLRILFPRVESGGRDVLVREFCDRGATVVEVPAYESRCPASIDPGALAALRSGRIQVITFASSKTVRHFVQLIEAAGLDRHSLSAVQLASIGPQTSATCRELFGRVEIEATTYTLDGLTEAIVQSRQIFDSI
jgi:uroporphyrinogen III methyltransferase / synthase